MRHIAWHSMVPGVFDKHAKTTSWAGLQSEVVNFPNDVAEGHAKNKLFSPLFLCRPYVRVSFAWIREPCSAIVRLYCSKEVVLSFFFPLSLALKVSQIKTT